VGISFLREGSRVGRPMIVVFTLFSLLLLYYYTILGNRKANKQYKELQLFVLWTTKANSCLNLALFDVIVGSIALKIQSFCIIYSKS
jgi:hypothetical protein